jgi:hypothetical protein
MSMSSIADLASLAAESADVEKAGIRASQAATNITLDASKFDASVVKFDTAVQMLIRAVTPIGGAGGRLPTPSEIDAANAEKKQGGWIGNLFK